MLPAEQIIDLTEYQKGPILCPTSPNALTGEKMPVTLGHEFSGTVEAVGVNVNDIAIGDHVVVQPLRSDNTCEHCAKGLYTFCPNLGIVGLHG